MTSTEIQPSAIFFDGSFDTEKKTQGVGKQSRSQPIDKISSDVLIKNVEKNTGFDDQMQTSKRSAPELVNAELEGCEGLHESMTSRLSSPEDDAGSVEAFQDLKFLQDPITCATLPRTAMAFLKMIPPCLVSGLGYIGWCALTTIGFFACNKAKDPLLTSTLSLAMFFNTMSIQSMNYASAEKAGIAMSQAYGAKDYRGVKKYFCQSLLMGLIYASVIGIPLMLFAEKILLAFQIVPELAKSVHSFYWKIALIDIFRLVSNLLMVFASSQGIETTFFGLMITNTLISCAFMCFLCFYVGLVLDALVYSLILFQAFNLIIFSKVYLFECDKKTIGLVSFFEAMDGFINYMKDWTKYFVGIWIEWIAWEVSTYFAALTNDINQVAAFGSIINVAYISIMLQFGFRMVARSRINYLIAKGYIDAAKRCFFLIFVGIICLNILFGILLFFLRDYIADLYAGNIPKTHDYLIQLIIVYCIGMSSDQIYGLLSLVSRVIDHIGFSIFMNVTFMICMMSAIHYVLVKVLHLTVFWIAINMYSTFALVYGLMFIKFAFYDWHKAPTVNN